MAPHDCNELHAKLSLLFGFTGVVLWSIGSGLAPALVCFGLAIGAGKIIRGAVGS